MNIKLLYLILAVHTLMLIVLAQSLTIGFGQTDLLAQSIMMTNKTLITFFNKRSKH